MSILLHIILIGGAMLLVVQVMQKKEALKFTAPPPASNPAKAVEHKVKMAKKEASMSAPTISKRVTSTAANATIALPPMEMNNSTSTDVMSGVMNGVGSGGLGAGGNGGGAGMASKPLAGLTAFGFRGAGLTGGLVGHLYDLKQTADGKPTDITYGGNRFEGALKDHSELDKLPGVAAWVTLGKIIDDPKSRDLITDSYLNHIKFLNEYFDKRWDENLLKRYYQSKEALMAYQMFIPNSSAEDAINAFGVEKEVKATHFIIYYKGSISPPRDGQYRFVGRSGNGSGVAVRLDGQNVFMSFPFKIISHKPFDFKETDTRYHNDTGYPHGKWVTMEKGRKYPMEVLLDGGWGGVTVALMMEEKNPPTPYLPRHIQDYLIVNEDHLAHPVKKDPKTEWLRYPLFTLRKGLPVPEYRPVTSMVAPAGEFHGWGPWEYIPEVAPEPILFNGQ
jgi:hypothetical protein